MPTLQERLQQQEKELDALRAQVELLRSILVAGRVAAPAPHKPPAHTGVDALPTLTLKQHATLLGVCAHLPWGQLAEHMRVDRTTVKLHLRAISEKLGTPGLRTEIAAHWAPIIDRIPDEEYKQRFGIHKRWWIPGTEDRATLTILRTKRSSGGQNRRVSIPRQSRGL